jgi:predicted methyltransferase
MRSPVFAALAVGFWCIGCGPTAPPPSSPASPVEEAGTPPSRGSDTPLPLAAPSPADPIASALAAPDRSSDDRALDAGRKSGETLAFFGIAPGMRVAELGAGGGYTTELLARIVGASGKVYAQNSKIILERFAEKPWSERLAKPVMQGVVRVDRELDDPLPADAKELDAVVFILFYHDSVWMKTDRDRMNRAVFAALKPGGIYGIVDHSAREGAGLGDVETLHRIEQTVLRAEVERAGFVLDGEGAFLKHADDTRDWNASPRKAGERRGTSDRFVLRFKRPPPR